MQYGLWNVVNALGSGEGGEITCNNSIGRQSGLAHCAWLFGRSVCVGNKLESTWWMWGMNRSAR